MINDILLYTNPIGFIIFIIIGTYFIVIRAKIAKIVKKNKIIKDIEKLRNALILISLGIIISIIFLIYRIVISLTSNSILEESNIFHIISDILIPWGILEIGMIYLLISIYLFFNTIYSFGLNQIKLDKT